MNPRKIKNQQRTTIGALGVVGGMALLLNSASAQTLQNDLDNFKQIDPSRWQVQSDGSLLFTDAAGIERTVEANLFLVDNGLLFVHEGVLEFQDQTLAFPFLGDWSAASGAGGLLGAGAWFAVANRGKAEPLSLVLSVGSQVVGGQTIIDLSQQFTADSALTFSISDGDIPDGFSFDASTGILSQDNPSSPIGVGDHVITVRAEDNDGLILTTTVKVVVALNHDFEGSYAVGITESISGSSSADILNFDDSAAAFSGSLTLDTGDGNDELKFGDNTAFLDGELVAGTGNGDDELEFGGNAAFGLGTLVARTGNGNDEVEFGDWAAGGGGNIKVYSGSGDDTIKIGGSASPIASSSISVETGEGNDTLTVGAVGSLATDIAIGDGFFAANLGAGSDNLSFLAKVGSDLVGGGDITIDLGVDSDVDSVVFSSSVYGVSISNWTMGIDSRVDVVNVGDWAGSIVANDVVLTGSTTMLPFGRVDTESIVFEGLASTGASVDVALFLM